MAKTKHKQPKRLRQGRDWHGWAWKTHRGRFLCFAEDRKPGIPADLEGGKWVRVKFVEVQ